MATEILAEVGDPATRQDEVTRDSRRVALAVPAIAVLGGVAAMAIEPRFGLFAAALVFGWTQLVGL
ncbi:MAG: hypothetical protein ACRDJH_10840 [Thermomicrobiales bacterium]